jgi:hypothetical protein
MSDPTNPFAALSLIVAPAVLTNASSKHVAGYRLRFDGLANPSYVK